MDFIFNVAKGAHAHYARLGASSDALIGVPIEGDGYEGDAATRDHNTLADVLATATDEQPNLGRKVLTGVTVTVDDSGDKVVVNGDDVVWANPTGPNTAKLLVCYDGDTGSGDDTAVIPLYGLDMVATDLAGPSLTYEVNAAGFADAT